MFDILYLFTMECRHCSSTFPTIRSSDCNHTLCFDCWQIIYDSCQMVCPICKVDNSEFLSNNFEYSRNSVNKYKEVSFHLITDLQKALQMLDRYKQVASNNAIDEQISLLFEKYNSFHLRNVSDICYYPYDSKYDQKKYSEMFKNIY